jgi:tRNA G18 (ribose-2'-O)-methylase SpoU
MTPKIQTQPMLELTENHKEALKQGKEFFKDQNLNVIDEFKSLSNEEIREKLKERHNSFACCFENILGDFNFSCGIRSANALGVKEVFYVGGKKFNRVGAMGTYHYTNVNFLPTIKDLLSLKEKYTFVGVDNVPGSIPIETYEWKESSMLIFGEEGCGLTKEMQTYCQDIVHISMFGSVRSLNIASAASIAMYDFVQKTSSHRVTL